jgi:4-aminobutyrate aminotransferase-like enzyme
MTSDDDREVLALLDRRDRVFGKGSTIFYSKPVHLVRGEGVWLYDATGRRYLDLYNNVPVVGHCNPRVVDAVSRQAATHTVHSRYLDSEIVEFAEELLALHPDHLDNVVFACSGTEANEVAMMMARIATGGRGVICSDAAYHGNSALVGALTMAPREGRPDVRSVPFPETYRPIVDAASEADLCEAYLAHVQRAIDGFAADGVPLAGLLMCSLFANEGLPNVPADYLARASEMVRAAGGVVIMDEVQSGYCRSGRWWGYQVMGVQPDIVTTGKPMGNGVPLSACVARHELVEAFRARTRYFNTFAGSPLQAAAGRAVLHEIHDRNLLAQVNDVGPYLTEQLRRLTADDPSVGDVRGCGLFIGIEWVVDRESKEPDERGAVDMVERLRDKGFLISNAGVFDNVLKVRPPLVFEREHADLFLQGFADTLREIRA